MDIRSAIQMQKQMRRCIYIPLKNKYIKVSKRSLTSLKKVSRVAQNHFRRQQNMNSDNTVVSRLIIEFVNASETAVGSLDIHRALKRRLRNKAPGYSTVQKKLAELVEEGKLARTRLSRALIYRGPPPERLGRTPLMIPDRTSLSPAGARLSGNMFAARSRDGNLSVTSATSWKNTYRIIPATCRKTSGKICTGSAKSYRPPCLRAVRTGLKRSTGCWSTCLGRPVDWKAIPTHELTPKTCWRRGFMPKGKTGLKPR